MRKKLQSKAESRDRPSWQFITPEAVRLRKYSREWGQKKQPALSDLLKTLLIFAVFTVLGFVIQWLKINEANIMMLYLVGVLVTASVTGRRIYSILYSVGSLLGFNYFFTLPKLSLSAYDPSYPLTFLIMFAASLITGNLVSRIKTQRQQAETAAYYTAILLETNQLIQKERDEKGIAEAAANQIQKLCGKTVLFYASDAKGALQAPTVYPDGTEISAAETGAGEIETAARVFLETADTMPVSDSRGTAYFPVRTAEHTYGVFAVDFGGTAPDTFENGLIASIIGECALALEKEYYNQRREEAAVRAKNERMRADFLRSISHDLRTPLTSISGSARVLMKGNGTIREDRKQELYADIYEDAVWLINLVENLLSITRIEGDTVALRLQTELVDEVIGEALRHVNDRNASHTIRVEQDEICLLAKMDARLIVQVIVNIVNNAVKYTPPGSEIVIRAERRNGFAAIEIADNGAGISDEEKPRIFDMFYTSGTVSADGRRGMGLGLALCKLIVEAHGGTIDVRDNTPHGAVFLFTLPADGADNSTYGA